MTESVHAVAGCAVDSRGATLWALGDVDEPILLRSTAKPFIAAAAVRAGVVERFGLEPREIALMAASHNGEPYHVDGVRSMLRKIGLDEGALACGPHPPYDPISAQALQRQDVAFSAIHNNCSGKHAGILALCVATGSDPGHYLEVGSRAQQEILSCCARLSGLRSEQLRLAVDGCGIPAYALPLRNAALSYAHLASLESLEPREAAALRVVRDAMIAHPEYVAGTGDFDTVVMQTMGGRLAAKSGAEGVQGMAALEGGIGIVFKVVDGNGRAVSPAACAILEDLGILREAERPALERFARPILYNRAGRAVGNLAARSQHAIPR